MRKNKLFLLLCFVSICTISVGCSTKDDNASAKPIVQNTENKDNTIKQNNASENAKKELAKDIAQATDLKKKEDTVSDKNTKKGLKTSTESKSSDNISKANPPLPADVIEKLLITNDDKKTSQSNDKNKVLLKVNTQLQQVWNYCAPTTVSMMLSSRGVSVDQFTLAKEMGTYEPFGTHNKDAIRILNKHLFGYETPKDGQAGYRLAEVTNPTNDVKLFNERLVKNINDGYPLYLTFDVSKVYPGKTGEHNVIAIGYKLDDKNKDVEWVYYLDPSPIMYDQNYGALKIIKPLDLLNSMLTCEEPNYAW